MRPQGDDAKRKFSKIFRPVRMRVCSREKKKKKKKTAPKVKTNLEFVALRFASPREI